MWEEPAGVWSTDLMETFWRMLNGPDGVCSDMPSAATGKEKREKTRIAASLKDFLSLINTDTFGSVLEPADGVWMKCTMGCLSRGAGPV